MIDALSLNLVHVLQPYAINIDLQNLVKFDLSLHFLHFHEKSPSSSKLSATHLSTASSTFPSDREHSRYCFVIIIYISPKIEILSRYAVLNLN